MKKLTILVLMLAFAWGASAQFYMHVWYNDSVFTLPVLNVDSITFTDTWLEPGEPVDPEIPVIESTITIDGDNTDWAEVPMLTEPGAAGPVVKMVVPQDGITLAEGTAFALMVEGDHELILAGYPVIFTDADMSNTTGDAAWYCPSFGKDYELATWNEGSLFGPLEEMNVREMSINQAAFTGVPFTGSVSAFVAFDWGSYMIPAIPTMDAWIWSETKYHPFYVRPFSYAKLNTIHTAGDAYSTHRALLPGESLQLSESGIDTALWVSWAVELKEVTTYNVYINVNATNMTSIDLWLVDPATNEVVAEFKGEDVEAPVGVTAYGTWDLSAVPAGKYMLKAKNHVQWSNLVFHSVSFEIAGGGTTDEPSTPSEPETPSEGIGVFSVSADKKVTFSPGNLQYHPANDEWRFAENQTDYIGEENENIYISSTYNGWLDLFGWGTGNNPNNSSRDYNDYQTFVDWGTNQIGADAPNTWRTLTNDEWEYLLNTRPNASSLKGVAQVNGVNGLVFLPDNWTCPSGVTFKSGFHSEYSVEAYGQYQTFSAAQWSKLESAGAVFLPASGNRVVSTVQNFGRYWSATENSSYNARSLFFDSFEAGLNFYDRCDGHSVRLVKDTIANSTNQPTDPYNGHEYVDLGLPSGLKWATCNVGANAPEEYGDYFAWGEVESKTTYNWSTYKWCNGSNNTLTKYNYKDGYGTLDNKMVLDKEDDAAAVNWGGAWRMPTKAEQDELLSNCTWTWTTQNGVNGYKVTGPSGNCIFLPAVGYRKESSLSRDGSNGNFWLSSIYEGLPDNAYGLFFDSEEHVWSIFYRFYGRPVRPVCDTPDDVLPSEPEAPTQGIGVFSISADKQVTFSPGNLQYHPANNEWRFAESQLDYIGDANSNCSSTYNGWLDLFGWSTSTTNFGVSTSEDNNDYSGSFVDWGSNQIGSDAPKTWRTLTYDEWNYLLKNRTNASFLQGVAQVNDVNGLILLPDNWTCPEGVTFKSGFPRSYGDDDYAAYQTFTADQWTKLEIAGAVFLPVSGHRYGSDVYNVQYHSYYWSATDIDSTYAYFLSFGLGGASMGDAGRTIGFSVRLVKDL